jgi:hypothetical protein
MHVCICVCVLSPHIKWMYAAERSRMNVCMYVPWALSASTGKSLFCTGSSSLSTLAGWVKILSGYVWYDGMYVCMYVCMDCMYECMYVISTVYICMYVCMTYLYMYCMYVCMYVSYIYCVYMYVWSMYVVCTVCMYYVRMHRLDVTRSRAHIYVYVYVYVQYVRLHTCNYNYFLPGFRRRVSWNTMHMPSACGHAPFQPHLIFQTRRKN